LAAARLSKPNAKDGFRDASRQGFAVRCGYKAEDGYLYPLTGAFFFVHKPPLQLPYEDVEGVEFARQQAGAGLLSGAARTFDLAIRMRGGQEHQFRGIQRTEWQGLFDWIQGRGIHIENVDSARRGPGGGAAAAGGFALGDDEDGDLGGGRGGGGGDGDESSEDSDFEGGSSDASESSSGGSGSGSGSGSDSDAEMVDEEGVKATAIKKKKAAAGGGKKAAAGKKRGAGGSSDEGGDGSPATSPAVKKKKKRAKKDPNAPKKAISAFFYFGAAKREEIKREQPGITIGEVGKKLGELWRAATADEKKPFDEMAERDKERYAREMEAWKAKGAAGGGGASSEEGEEGEKTGGKDEEMEEAGAKEEEDGGKAAAASGDDE
jgi:structure-specific recognition protein 1